MTVSTKTEDGPWASRQHRRTVLLIVTVVTTAILFDGYDLVVYGAVLPQLLSDPTQIGEISAQTGGLLGSYALIGVLIGSLGAGAIGDRVGRRRVMLVAAVWFSLGMGLTAMTQSITSFGVLRFLTGIGVGMIVATGGAIVAEFAPADRRNLFNAITYSGIPAGGFMASVLAMVFLSDIGWRGMFFIGAAPLLFLVPMIWFWLPESPRWLSLVGRQNQAERLCEQYGLPPEQFAQENVAKRSSATTVKELPEKRGFAALFSRRYIAGTTLIGLMSFIGLLLTYGLNTWLPEIMRGQGEDADGSLGFLLVLNGGAIGGVLIASVFADRVGPKRIVATTFLIAAMSLLLIPLGMPVGLLYIFVALAGVGAIGTQVLVYGFSANYYGTEARAAGVAWCAGFGRLGGILGPIIGGTIVGLNLGAEAAFYIFSGFAALGCVFTSMIPKAPPGVQKNATEVRVEGEDDFVRETAKVETS
ncbi:aromatic acid/H+ symport family MFS transporter [Corynebacterium sp.]|uniref:MFS transporter n=1 Tax=Corynebacterium sp. TaxID=1720 RepID=UPI0028AD5F0C|nr:aromatic acid/H+ symport family MFS transporter [Corynebacterium sp.]